MAHSYIHARSSAKKFGGQPEDYIKVHDFFDQTKAHLADARHRMILHNSFGIFLAEQLFGHVITNSDGKEIPVRIIAEQHVREDFGFIPSVEQCFENFPLEPWMYQGAAALSRDPSLRVQRPTPESRQPQPIPQTPEVTP